MTLRLDAVTVGYRRGRRTRRVLDHLTLTARPGELTALIGPNGTGKSTLLRSIAGLQPLLGGRITLDDADLARMSPDERARRQAVVLTERVAPGILTARELVGLGRHPHTGFTGRLGPRDWAIVDQALTDVDASHLADRDLSELSDGERQRVMTARALAQEPTLLLMDEPSAFLDAPGRVGLTGLVNRIATDQNKIVILSTHEVELALRIADVIWLLDRSGQVHAATPEELVLAGTLAEVFDSDQLAFDPATFGFVLTKRRERGRVRVTGSPHPVIGNLLARREWTIQDEGPADAELRFEESGPGTNAVLLADGRTQPVSGLPALDRALGRLDREPALARVSGHPVRTLLDDIATVTDFFDVKRDRGRPLAGLNSRLIADGIDRTCAQLGSPERRVGASTWQFALAARVWSVVLGGWIRAGLVVDVDKLQWIDDQSHLSMPQPSGWLDRGAEPERVATLMAMSVWSVFEPLHLRIREDCGVAAGLLEGNLAAAVTGTFRAMGRTEPDLVKALFAQPPLAGRMVEVTDRNGSDPVPWARRTCCLIYRTPAGDYCGDCSFSFSNHVNPTEANGSRPVRTASSSPSAVPRTRSISSGG